ncbi:MAG: manganese efflux pump [Bacilli bacterium]|nr:manganese efflux pump [Bacilli bacterium]
MNLLLIFIIAVSLSMDAFSLSLAYGTLSISVKERYFLSTLVGVFHFFMPIIGNMIGNRIFELFKFDPDFLVFIILCFIGIQMVFQSFKNENVKRLKFFEFFFFAFAVSIDSFSVGIGLFNITKNYIISAFVFSLCSFLFTYFGLLLGNKIKKSVGKISTVIGGAILIIIGLFYLV